jgi:hypothetical protein
LSARRVALHAAQQGDADCRSDDAWRTCLSFCADSSSCTSGANCLARSIFLPHHKISLPEGTDVGALGSLAVSSVMLVV